MSNRSTKICDFCNEPIKEYIDSEYDENVQRVMYYTSRGRNHKNVDLHSECFDKAKCLLAKLCVIDTLEAVGGSAEGQR